MRYTGKDHTILIGLSDNSKLAIREILKSDSNTEIVIIDGSEQSPMIKERLFYIQGYATDEEVLLAANLPEAKRVIIFADQSTRTNNMAKDASLIDGKTLLIATAIAEMNTPVHITAEVINQKYQPLFKDVKVNEFLALG